MSPTLRVSHCAQLGLEACNEHKEHEDTVSL